VSLTRSRSERPSVVGLLRLCHLSQIYVHLDILELVCRFSRWMERVVALPPIW
jgi:hypothetical protein